MSNVMERIEVFQDTVVWTKEDPMLKESISLSEEKTQIFHTDEEMENYRAFRDMFTYLEV